MLWHAHARVLHGLKRRGRSQTCKNEITRAKRWLLILNFDIWNLEDNIKIMKSPYGLYRTTHSNRYTTRGFQQSSRIINDRGIDGPLYVYRWCWEVHRQPWDCGRHNDHCMCKSGLHWIYCNSQCGIEILWVMTDTILIFWVLVRDYDSTSTRMRTYLLDILIFELIITVSAPKELKINKLR